MLSLLSCVRGGGLNHWLNNERSSINATQNTDTTSYVSVGEIWNETEGYFNANTLSSLLQYITGNEDITASDVASTKINQTRTSADIRTSTANGKTTSQDVQVTFGGLTWTVVYLSQDTNGNDIVTLWLSNNKQDAWSGRPTDEGAYYGFIDGALYSDWSADWSSTSRPSLTTYVSNLYSTSYIRVVTLNNGSNSTTYATSTSAVSSAQPQNANNVFALFTMEEVAGNVTDYLVTPSQVEYQKTETAVGTENADFNYIAPNDAYGTPSSGSWYNSNYNYTNKTRYTEWQNDYIWLPSIAETGKNDTNNGIWDTRDEQRANNSGASTSDDQINTGVGSSNSDNGTYVWDRSWLRSGDYYLAHNAYYLFASGSGYRNYNVNNSYAVRPALHLNLNSAASNSYDPTVWDGTSTEAPTLQNPAQANSEDNPYIIDTAAKLAWISANFDQRSCYGQHYLQTVNIDLASHPWIPINNVADTSSSNRREYNYDGGNHTISNLYINTSEQTLTSNNYIGLFGLVYGSSSNHCYIKNLGIVNGSIAGEGSRYVGAVVGYSYYTDITNCYNEGVSVTGSDYVGGVAGYSYEGTISNSYNTGAVTGSSSSVGGVVGRNYGTISNSYNTGTVTGSGSVGGVAGYNNNGTIINSYNIGAVTGSSSSVGGVVGNNNSHGTISNSYNEGDVTGNSNSVGGVAGSNHETISNSYNTGTVSGSERVGGVAGVNSYGTISSSYNTGAVSGDDSVGGVAGRSYGTISNSYNEGDVTGTGNVGGVVGYNWGTISSSYNTGAVTGTGNYIGGVAGYNYYGTTISNSYNTGNVTGETRVGGVAGHVQGSSNSHSVISSCYSTGEIIRSSGSETSFGGVVGYINNSTFYPSQYVSISWCYYNTETVGSVVTKAIGEGNGYQVYGLTTAQMQGDKNQNYMYLSDTMWNFASGQYPTLKYVATAQN